MPTNFTMYRYNGSTWIELHPKTNAGQVNQTTDRVFLHPSTNKVNGKAFGTMSSSNVWTPAAITLYASDIALSASDATTISDAISAINTTLSTVVQSTNALTAEQLVVGNGNRNVKSSGYTISGDSDDISDGTETAIPTAYAIGNYLDNLWAGSTNITTLGTISSGTWQGTAIGLAYGGTGATTAAGARNNLGLKEAATHDVASSADDIKGATSSNTNLTTAYAVQQYVATIQISYTVVWNKSDYTSATAPTTAKLGTIPKDVVVKYNNGASSATGTLVASQTQKNNLLLIYSPNNEDDDAYDEYICAVQGSSYVWEKLGSTAVDLSNYVQADNNLTLAEIVVGDSNKKIKSSGFYVSDDVQEAFGQGSDVTVPTGSAIDSYLNNWTGSNKITTVGTISSGVWQGTSIAANKIADLASNKITAMTGYSIASSFTAIETSDSLNTAIGKLEKLGTTNATNISTNATNITNLQSRAQIFWNTATSGITGMKTGDFAFIYS